MNDHSGHRNRIRERLIKNGFEGFAPHEVLEYILFCFIPRRNTNDIAHRLLDAFGSLQGVCRAGYDQLRQIPGMTDNAALFLASVPSFLGLYNASINDTTVINSLQDAVQYIAARVDVSDCEQVAVLCLNAGGRILRTFINQSGAPDQVLLSLRGLITQIAQTHAVNVIVGHNHPSGDVTPSRADKQLAQQLRQSLEMVGVNLLDFIIVGQERFYAFSQTGFLGNDGYTDRETRRVSLRKAGYRTRSAPAVLSAAAHDAYTAEDTEYHADTNNYNDKNNGYRPLFGIQKDD